MSICREGLHIAMNAPYETVHHPLTDAVVVATRNREQNERDRSVGTGDFREAEIVKRRERE